jgi:hypothetical protein
VGNRGYFGGGADQDRTDDFAYLIQAYSMI